MNVEAFIHAIMDRPPIWMSSHGQYKNKPINKKLWEEVKEQFPDHEVDDLKKRWKNLKDAYRKELRKYPDYSSGNVNLQSNWRFFELLSFMREEYTFKQEQNTNDAQEVGTTQSASDNDSKETSGEPSVSNIKKIPQPSPKPDSPCPSEDLPPATKPMGKKRNSAANVLRFEYLEIERKKLKILEQELERNNDKQEKKSDNYHFLMSILPDMDKLPPVQKMRLRNKINEAVLDEINILYGEDIDQLANEPVISDEMNNIKEEQCETYYFTQ